MFSPQVCHNLAFGSLLLLPMTVVGGIGDEHVGQDAPQSPGAEELGVPRAVEAENNARASRHFQIGQQAKGAEDFPRALRQYSEAIHLDSRFAEAYGARAEIYVELGEKWKALLDIRKAIELDPDNQSYHQQLELLVREPVDLRTWQQEGVTKAGNWNVSKDGTSVLQKVNGAPTFFISSDAFVDTTIKGKFRVETTDDDDFIGFVFGYRAPLQENGDAQNDFDFRLFDWKQATQKYAGTVAGITYQGETAREGFSLVRVHGEFEPSRYSGFWDHTTSPEFEVLATDFGPGKGWKDRTEYEFELVYRHDRLKISIDGKQVFDLNGDFPPGRFGFFNYSQSDVRYAGFTRSTLRPPPAQLTVRSGELPTTLIPAVDLILDSSGSMQELVQGQQKSVIARQITEQVLANLPANRQVGLRLFGHWGRWVGRIKDPNAGPVPAKDPRMNKDSQLVVPIGALTSKQRKNITTWLNWSKPRGYTPLVYSLLEAKNDFPSGLQSAKTIVLVSDGQETCGGDLADVAKAYNGAGIEVTIHVVGFNVQKDEEATKQLRRIAAIGGGKYFGANNARQLGVALGQAVEVGFVVEDMAMQEQVAFGIVNGAPISVPPGEYYIQVDGLPNRVQVELKPGEETRFQLDGQGQLSSELRGKR